MLAYHNDPALKDKLLANLAAHAQADELIQGQYWEDGKGCAVACTLIDFDRKAAKEGSHERYEDIFGIPQVLAHLEDCLFEGLTNGKAKEWPIRFSSAIQPGVDLSMVWPRFAFWLLTEEVTRNIDRDKHREQWVAIEGAADLYKTLIETGKPVPESAARSAARSADTAARSADTAAEIAYSAAEIAYSAAESARSAADSAAWSTADSAAESAAYIRMADKLVELLESAAIQDA
jgi:hypothetical protein